MVKIPACLSGTLAPHTIRLSKPKKCPKCGMMLTEVECDAKGNRCCINCGHDIDKRIQNK